MDAILFSDIGCLQDTIPGIFSFIQGHPLHKIAIFSCSSDGHCSGCGYIMIAYLGEFTECEEMVLNYYYSNTGEHWGTSLDYPDKIKCRCKDIKEHFKDQSESKVKSIQWLRMK